MKWIPISSRERWTMNLPTDHRLSARLLDCRLSQRSRSPSRRPPNWWGSMVWCASSPSGCPRIGMIRFWTFSTSGSFHVFSKRAVSGPQRWKIRKKFLPAVVTQLFSKPAGAFGAKKRGPRTRWPPAAADRRRSRRNTETGSARRPSTSCSRLSIRGSRWRPSAAPARHPSRLP
jgi:hypothetical protein